MLKLDNVIIDANPKYDLIYNIILLHFYQIPHESQR